MKVIEELLNNCTKYKEDIENWKLEFRKAYIRYDFYFKDKKYVNIKYNIDIVEYNKVIRAMESDIALIMIRYGTYDDCANFKGINKYKIFGAFIYHFMRLLPVKGNRHENILTLFLLIHLIGNGLDNFGIVINEKIKKEFFYFIENRIITSESLYMFLQALSHNNIDTNTPIVKIITKIRNKK